MSRIAILLLFISVVSFSNEGLCFSNPPGTELVPPASSEEIDSESSTPASTAGETVSEEAPFSRDHSVLSGQTSPGPAPVDHSRAEAASSNDSAGTASEPNVTVKETKGNAILHLTVPSGSYVTINGNRTRNRNWNQHRHYLLTGVPVKDAREVEVVVKIRKDRSRCTFNGGTCCSDCGTDYHTCCKTVDLAAGDEEYLTFDFKTDSDSEGVTASLNYKILTKIEFSKAAGDDVSVIQKTSVHIPTKSPATAANLGHVL